jgi:hypothetical protein
MNTEVRHLRRAVTAAVAGGLLAAVGLGSPAYAVSAQVKKACQGDYKRLCPSYKVGSPQLRACMEAKQAEISSRCVDALIASGEVNRTARR